MAVCIENLRVENCTQVGMKPAREEGRLNGQLVQNQVMPLMVRLTPSDFARESLQGGGATIRAEHEERSAP